MRAAGQEMFAKLQAKFDQVFADLGAESPAPFLMDAAYHLVDVHLQMCIPSVEYPRSDAPSKFRFAGGLPKAERKPYIDTPKWWDEIVTNETKKIIGVSQGSLAIKYSDLTIPTMEAFKDRDDILVVVALGRRGAILPDDVKIPANVRVVDYIPFDELFPHLDLYVTNGGYGAFQHGISNGIPMIIAGESEDKPETAARAEYAGVAIK